VIDPTKVARTALQDAASVATRLITTEDAFIDAGRPAFSRCVFPTNPTAVRVCSGY